MSHRWTSMVSLTALVVACGTLSGLGISSAGAAAPLALREPEVDKTKDTLIFRNGRTLVGAIVSETPTKIRFKAEVNGIPLETEYDKSEILKVVRATAKPDGKTDGKTDGKNPVAPAPTSIAPAAAADPAKVQTPEDPSGKKKVYTIELTGRFGRDISETPLRDAMKDAQKLGADIVVISVDAAWKFQGEEAGDDATNFDEVFRAEKIGPVVSDEIELWPRKPQVVMWVKKAMGGAAFLPFYSRDIYFSSEGRMGGIGYLEEMMEGVGDDVVQEKQYSLRLGHARGVANKYGYDFRIINAMTVTKYVLSAKIEGGRVTYFERMPEGPDEILLTDDGSETNRDTVKQIVSGEGNDVLTLNPRLARDLGVSKDTVDSLEDLMVAMGHSRNWVELKDGKGTQIMKRWGQDFTDALRDLQQRLPQRLSEVQGGGTYEERTKARGQRKRILQEMQGIYRKYKEIFGEETALQEISRLNTEIELIEQEQQREAQEKRRGR
ncbi:MAG: hypothetical protein AMXMBFR58_21900 [Phycisphaerae bacterium]